MALGHDRVQEIDEAWEKAQNALKNYRNPRDEALTDFFMKPINSGFIYGYAIAKGCITAEDMERRINEVE